MKLRLMSFWGFVRKYPLYGLYLLILLVALCKQWISPAELIDSGEYRNAAQNFSAGNGWSACLTSDICDQLSLPETRRTPGYPILIALFHFTNLLLLFQTILSAMVPLLMYKLLIKTGMEYCFKIVMILLLLYPLQFYYATMLMPDIICQVLVLSLVMAFIEKRWWHVSLMIIALMLLKPVFVPFAWMALAGLYFFSGKQKVWLVLPALTVLIVSWFNKHQTGVFHYTSMPVTNAFEYNIRNLVKVQTSGDETYYKMAAQKLDSLDFSGKYNFMQRETQRAISMSPLKYIFLHIKGSAKAVLDPGRYDFVAFFQLPQGRGFMDDSTSGFWASQPPAYWFYIIFFGLLALLKAVLTMITLFFKKFPQKWILLFPIIYTLAVVGPVGSARYLLPVMPIFIIFAAIGWYILFNKKHYESTVAE
ncbi:MAG: hypothetical protein EBV15_03495 [Bacteroidetes bacterium]|nr:hypothetical protein [Bacteroidota bacterium]